MRNEIRWAVLALLVAIGCREALGQEAADRSGPLIPQQAPTPKNPVSVQAWKLTDSDGKTIEVKELQWGSGDGLAESMPVLQGKSELRVPFSAIAKAEIHWPKPSQDQKWDEDQADIRVVLQNGKTVQGKLPRTVYPLSFVAYFVFINDAGLKAWIEAKDTTGIEALQSP